jgi:regulatory protein YycI of two-component signal transduction system YycFG
MGKIYNRYYDGIESLLSTDDVIFFDNVFPFLIDQFVQQRFIDKSEIGDYSLTANYLAQKFEDNNGSLIIPFKIYKQAIKGREVEKNTIRRSSKTKALGNVIKSYEFQNDLLMESLANNVYAHDPNMHTEFNAYLSFVKDTTKKFGLKKFDHKDDNYADETLVATAFYHAEKNDESVAILTNDNDICRIVDGCIKRDNQMHGVNNLGPVSVYFLNDFGYGLPIKNVSCLETVVGGYQ